MLVYGAAVCDLYMMFSCGWIRERESEALDAVALQFRNVRFVRHPRCTVFYALLTTGRAKRRDHNVDFTSLPVHINSCRHIGGAECSSRLTASTLLGTLNSASCSWTGVNVADGKGIYARQVPHILRKIKKVDLRYSVRWFACALTGWVIRCMPGLRLVRDALGYRQYHQGLV